MQLSMVRRNLSVLDNVDLVLIRRTLVLSLLSLRKFDVTQNLILFIHSVREDGERLEVGLPER